MRREPLKQSRSRANADRIKDWVLAVSRDGSRAIPSLASAFPVTFQLASGVHKARESGSN
jgi:hypothetical protein